MKKSISLIPALAALQVAGQLGNSTFIQMGSLQPNATGSVNITGADMTQGPRVFNSVEWTASLNVTSIIGADPSKSSLAITNSAIGLNANGYFVPNATTWSTCVVVMTDVSQNATINGQKDTGSCQEAFSQACVLSFEGALIAARNAAINEKKTGVCGGMTFPSIPDECSGFFDSSSTSTDIRSLDQVDGSWLFAWQDDPHDPSNTTIYEQSATRIWPVILIQSNLNATSTGVTSVGFTCLRATDASPGSAKIGPVPGANQTDSSPTSTGQAGASQTTDSKKSDSSRVRLESLGALFVAIVVGSLL